MSADDEILDELRALLRLGDDGCPHGGIDFERFLPRKNNLETDPDHAPLDDG